MRLGGLVEGRFITRLNRFAALVDVNGAECLVHVANSGRMRELLVEGYRVFLKPVRPTASARKTSSDLALVDIGHTPRLVGADARLPNDLVHEALEEGRLPQFKGYGQIRREAVYGESRLDLALAGEGGMCYVETKSVTLVEQGTGLFPDAPTSRGRKHMGSLANAVAAGHRAAVVFVVQRSDAVAFAPNDLADPQFGVALRQALAGGVEAYAYGCQVSASEIVLAGQLPVRL